MSPTSQVNDIQNPNGNIAKEQIKNGEPVCRLQEVLLKYDRLVLLERLR